MMKTNILLILCLALGLSRLHAEVLLCKASDSTQLKSCLTSNEVNIKVMTDFTVNLNGFSLKGVTLDIGSNILTIIGSPMVDSTTVFNTSGASGALVIVGTNGTFTFRENTVHGGVDLDFLNTTLIYPYYAANLQEALNMAVILPVSWLDFRAELHGEQVILHWSTASELNNRSFVIESSREGEVFQRLGEIAGAGTSNEPHQYHFTHLSPSAGVNYYRIKQQDTDQSFSYSKVLALNAPGSTRVQVYPNPSAEEFYVQYDASKGSSLIRVYDALGRNIPVQVAGYPGYYAVRWSEALPQGTYWLRVMRGGELSTQAILKK